MPISASLAVRFAAAALCLCGLSAPAGAQSPPVDEEPQSTLLISAFEQGDFETALRLARPLAERGDAMAQHLLGLMYSSGWGVKQDYGQASEWYLKAATQGIVAAQNNLGRLYAVGKGVPQDFVQAAFWYRKAAEQGAAQAYYNLGELHENGRGVPQNYQEAAALYRQAAAIALGHWHLTNTPPSRE